MSLTVQTAPSVEPITTAEAKTHLRVTTSASDTYIAALVTVARRRVESLTGRALVDTVFDFTTDALENRIRLPRAPVSAVTHVKLRDSDGIETTVSSSVYGLSLEDEVAAVVLDDDESWPVTDLRSWDPVAIRFTAGYGVAASDVPEDIRHAVKLLVGHYFENREPIAHGGTVSAIPETVDALLAPHTIRRF